MLHDDLPGSAANHFVRHVIQLCFETPAGDEELFLIQLVQVLQCGTPRRQKSGLEVSTGSAKESQIIQNHSKINETTAQQMVGDDNVTRN